MSRAADQYRDARGRFERRGLTVEATWAYGRNHRYEGVHTENVSFGYRPNNVDIERALNQRHPGTRHWNGQVVEQDE
jgi:hypothetical protein